MMMIYLKIICEDKKQVDQLTMDLAWGRTKIQVGVPPKDVKIVSLTAPGGGTTIDLDIEVQE